LQQHPRSRVLLTLAVCGLFSGIVLRDNLHARWAIIDDHEIAELIGPTGEMTFSQLGDHLATHTEVGNPTWEWPRYRPVYFSLRLTECLLWGNTPELWYLARNAMFAVSLALFWTVLWRWLGFLAGSLVLLVLLTHDFWGDIWCRLGPGETYAVVG